MRVLTSRIMQKLAKFPIKKPRIFVWSLGVLIAFFLGRHMCRRSIDFIVYYQGAKSLLAGRTDLYSNTFAWGPPMTYVYPPLFLLLVFPLGWLSFANAFGVWFALMMLATAIVVKRAYRQWRPRHRARYAWLMLALAGPFVGRGLISGNAHLFIVLLVIYAVLAWSAGSEWAPGFAIALAGAIKIFPLFLLPVFMVRREWSLATRVIGFTCILWLLPVVYFGPKGTVSLYRSWSNLIVFHLSRFENARSLNESLVGAMKRWLTHVDYSTHRDRNYPPANFTCLSPRELKTITYGVEGVLLALSLWMCAILRPAAVRPSADHHGHFRVATAGVIFVTAQLILGPYTPMLYLCGWLLVALALPAIMEGKGYLYNLLLGAGTINLLLFLVPGRMNQRALEAYGAFTLLGVLLWVLSMWNGWHLAQETGNLSI